MPIYHIFKTRHLLKEIKLLNNRKFNPRLSPISSKIVEIFIERGKNPQNTVVVSLKKIQGILKVVKC